MEEKRNGFTIIEVALVLGLAGLIFAMVFAVLPTVWANERDSERRNDALAFITKLKNYQTNNNRGALPSDWNEFKKDYLGSDFTDPRGNEYILTVTSCSTTSVDASCETKVTTEGILYITTSATCNGDAAVKSANQRKVAVQVKLERADGVFCANS